MKLSLVALVVSIGCSSPAKPAPQTPVTDPAKPTPTTDTTPPPTHDLPTTATQPDPETAPDAPLTGQAKIASEANDAGVKLMLDHKYADATSKFRDATVRSPQALYYFNLCSSLHQEGRFGEALTACNAVDSTNAKPELAAKTHKLEAVIKDDAKHQHIELTK